MAGHSASKDARKRAYVPAIHVFVSGALLKTWMPGTRPGMTDVGSAVRTLQHAYSAGLPSGGASVAAAAAFFSTIRTEKIESS
jgi:hypothetical protein